MAKFCGQCGTKLPDEALFCFSCGTKQDGTAVASEPVKEVPAKLTKEVPDAYMREKSYKEDLEDTVFGVVGGKSYVSFKNQLRPTQTKNAISFCNNDFLASDIVMVRDTTDFSSMKEGLIVTYYGAYYIWKGKMQSKIKFNQIQSMRNASSYGLGGLEFTLYNGRKVDFQLHSSKQFLIDLFVEICECISRHRENYPIEVN